MKSLPLIWTFLVLGPCGRTPLLAAGFKSPADASQWAEAINKLPPRAVQSLPNLAFVERLPVAYRRDPLSFSSLGPKEQVRLLRQAVAETRRDMEGALAIARARIAVGEPGPAIARMLEALQENAFYLSPASREEVSALSSAVEKSRGGSASDWEAPADGAVSSGAGHAPRPKPASPRQAGPRAGDSGSAGAVDITFGRLPDSPKVIELRQWSKWERPDYRKRAGKTLNLSRGSEAPVQQQILDPRHFDKPQRRLIARLRALMRDEKLQRRDTLRRWREIYEEDADGTGQAGTAEANREEQDSGAADLSPGVEIGAWRLTLKNGKVLAAIHASGRRFGIKGKDFMPALKELLDSKAVPLARIAMVQYFHAHPDAGPLSPGDEKTMLSLGDFFRKQGIRIPVHMYAIAEVEREAIVFHMGASSL